jgi:Periplasmic binding protein domain
VKLRVTGVALVVACTLIAVISGSASAHRSSALAAKASRSTKVQAAVAAADAAVKQYEAPQPALAIPPTTKPLPKHVRLAILTCANQPSCQAETNGTAAAAEKLGWSVKQYQSPLTPQGYQATWTSLLQGKPNAIIYSSLFPNPNIASDLAQVNADHIPSVSISPYTVDAAPNKAADGAKATVAGPPMYQADGELMGDVVVANAKGPADTLFVWDPTFSGIHGPVKQGFTSVVEGAGGTVSVLQISAANVGQSVPGQVVSYLQQHTGVKYVAFVVSDFDAGVAPALKAAGLASRVKIISRAPEASNLVAVKDGQEFAEVADENIAGGWRSTDDMLRILSGEPIYQVDPSGWHQIFVKGDVTETSVAPPTPGVPDAFLKAWHLAGK